MAKAPAVTIGPKRVGPKLLDPKKVRALTRAANLPKGKGATRVGHKIVKLYGPPKVGKTHGVADIEGAIWIVADPNCIPTLEELGKLPPPEDIHEVANLEEASAVVDALLDAADANAEAGKEPLGVPAVILDSDTAIFEWHQMDVAKETGQRYLGEAKGKHEENGWQKFNADFSKFIDKLAELGRYTNVIIIGHAAVKVNVAKGEYAGFALSPAMALKVGRAVNWILYQTMDTQQHADGDTVVDGLDTVSDAPDGKVRTRRAYNTLPFGGYTACANPRLFRAQEPVNLLKMLQKAGVL